MPYRLKAEESVGEGLTRVAWEELAHAKGQLEGGDGSGRDKAIHEARKSIKKLRALARLFRFELGPLFRGQNTRLRDLGRTLSEYRDASAMIETFDQLKEEYKDELGRRQLGAVRRGLLERKAEREGNASLADAMKSAAETIQTETQNVKAWQVQKEGFEAIGPGLKETYKRGRKALAIAKKHPTPVNFHEWRKRVKDLWYHVRLLESLWTNVMEAHEKSLKELETSLGDDHNLELLRDKVTGEPARYGAARDRALLLKLIGKYQDRLRENSLAVGERIYDEKPKQFLRRMSHLWAMWQKKPARKRATKEERQARAGKASTSAA